MLRNRSATGDLVPDPARFPNGWRAVTDFIHGLGMKSGLYTSKSPYTCAGFAASCENEFRDAALFASWQIDYGARCIYPLARRRCERDRKKC